MINLYEVITISYRAGLKPALITSMGVAVCRYTQSLSYVDSHKISNNIIAAGIFPFVTWAVRKGISHMLSSGFFGQRTVKELLRR